MGKITSIQDLIKDRYPELLTPDSGNSKEFDKIELTKEETDAAIYEAKRRKFYALKDKLNREREEENRKLFIGEAWSTEQTRGYMLHRMGPKFEKKFVLDMYNTEVFNLLCMYFSNDPAFVIEADKVSATSPDLKKGILLAGGYGVGKTWLMKLFSRNKRQSFNIVSAKDIADFYETGGQEAIEHYLRVMKNPVNDKESFYQEYSGWCFDDIGTESEKKNFGNHKNVIGDLIEKKYANGSAGIMLHGTTNLTAAELTDYYGGRVASRLKEIFNVIELKGPDRRS